MKNTFKRSAGIFVARIEILLADVCADECQMMHKYAEAIGYRRMGIAARRKLRDIEQAVAAERKNT